MAEQISPIPARIKNMAIGGHVAGADDIYDEVLMENQEIINSRITQDIININNSKGIAGGLATLGADGKVPSSQLPSYVDTIVEGYYYNDNFYSDAAHTSLITPEANTIYNDLDTNISYRYSGTHFVPISNSITADEEDITAVDSKLKFKNKEYNASDFSGLGRVYLRKNISGDKNVLTQSMINTANTEYIIQYDYDLLGASIQVPTGSILCFDGGSFNNGTVVGNATQISADKTAIFDGITIDGTWNVPEITSAWFKDAEEDNVIKQCFNFANDDIYNTIIIEDGTYNVDTLANKTGAITFGSNLEVILLGTIQQKTNSFTQGFVTNFKAGAENIYIHGSGIIIGDKATHPAPSSGKSEWGHGIYFSQANNVTVEGITIKDCWGDCISIGYMTTPSTNITLRGLQLDNGRRQGISVTSVKNLVVENCDIKNINGTAPQSGIDIEPNANSVVDNIVIRNCNITNCSGRGIQLYNVNIDSINDVLIQNVVIDGCDKGIGSSKVNITGLTIDSVTIKNHTTQGLVLRPYEDDESEVNLSNIRDVNITNVLVDSPATTGYNVYVWVHNGFIQGCTFKAATLLRTYAYTDESHPQHGLNVFASFILADNKSVVLQTGGVVSQASIECGELRLSNGHTQFIGCNISCSTIFAGYHPTTGNPQATSYNTFTACSIYCTGVIRLANYNNITQSVVSASELILGNYSTAANNNILTRVRCSGAQSALYNNLITVNTSVLNSYYVIRLEGNNSAASNNGIVISDDDNETIINGAMTFAGQGCVARNNSITLSGERQGYSLYMMYFTDAAAGNAIIENNTFNYASGVIGAFANSNTKIAIPYADVTKNKIGTTTERPTLLRYNKTFQYFDTTLNRPIWWNGTTWVNCTGEDPDAVATA